MAKKEAKKQAPEKKVAKKVEAPKVQRGVYTQRGK